MARNYGHDLRCGESFQAGAFDCTEDAESSCRFNHHAMRRGKINEELMDTSQSEEALGKSGLVSLLLKLLVYISIPTYD